MRKAAAALVVLGALLLLASCGAGEDASTEKTLKALSVDMEPPARKDANGNEVDPETNPYGRARTTLWKDCEAFFTGTPLAGTVSRAVLLGYDAGWATVGTDTDSSWAQYPNKPAAADVDGDGYDEIVVVYYSNDAQTVVLRELSQHEAVFETKAETSCAVADTANFRYRQSIAAGDIDGDARDEILATNGTMFLIYDDDYTVLHSATVSPLDTDTNAVLRVACADFDADGKDEIVLANGAMNDGKEAQAIIYDWESGSLVTLWGASAVSNGSSYVESAAIATGDLDGDHIPEIVFSGNCAHGLGSTTLVLDVGMDSGGRCVFSWLNTSVYDSENGEAFLSVACGDIDGDLVDEVACWDGIYELAYDSEAGKWNLGYNATWGENPTQSCWADMLAVGDVDGDGIAEIVMLGWWRDDLYVYGVNSAGQIERGTTIDTDRVSELGGLCLPDVDRDSTILAYQEHELLFTDPVIVAVITSPPYYEDAAVGQNTDACEMKYGTSSSDGTGSTNSFGFTASLAVGYKFGVPLIGETEIEAKVEEEFTWAWTNSTEITVTKEFACVAGEDKVVYTSIPFDVYYYEILSSPTASEIGTTTCISIPRQPVLLATTADYYNANNGDGQDVDETVVSSTKGDPWSYPTREDRDAIRTANGGEGLYTYSTDDEQTVGQGTSYNSLSIEEITSSENTFEFQHSVSIEAKAEAFGASVTVGLGMKYAYEYSQTVSAGTCIAASIGDISSANYSDYVFAWGLMAYPATAGSVEEGTNQGFTMVTCWVDEI